MARAPYLLNPLLLKDLIEAKAALARHGIVIIRAIETDLEPALISEAKNAMASSPRRLAQMKENELDSFAESLRKAAMESANEIKVLHTRLLTKLGTENLGELVKELEGIDQLFKWERISKSVDSVNVLLEKRGFRPIELDGPEALSDSFRVELEEKWEGAFTRFKLIAEQVVEDMRRQDSDEAVRATPATKKGRKKV